MFDIIVGIVLVLALVYVLWQKQELKKFEVTEYCVSSSKIQNEVTLAVIADLHGFEYGVNNQKLLDTLENNKPDVILIPGDMIVYQEPETYEPARKLLERLVHIAPVYYAFGNHELKSDLVEASMEFQEYIKACREYGISFLHNENREITIGENKIALAEIDVELAFYKKGRRIPMDSCYVKNQIGDARKDCFQLLLAHNPTYGDRYIEWGADLTLCGHNHGGLVRFFGGKSLMSPQLTWNPKYNAGLYQEKILVSRGLGTHTFHIRVNNRAELAVMKLMPNSLEKSKLY